MRFSQAALLALTACMSQAAELPIFDARMHYSHDAWELVPPKEAIGLLRKAGVRRALVSSSNDDGNQKLYAEAPDMILPSLRPYRLRSDVGTWVGDENIAHYMEERLKKYRYVAVGEFHLYGADADLPVPRRMVEMARQSPPTCSLSLSRSAGRRRSRMPACTSAAQTVANIVAGISGKFASHERVDFKQRPHANKLGCLLAAITHRAQH